jgi:hypothetical protein
MTEPFDLARIDDAGERPPPLFNGERTVAPPKKASEILRLVRSLLAEWFSRGHLLLRAWRQYDPEGTNSLRLVNERPVSFLGLLLRRLNEHRQAAWIEYVLNYQGPWYAWEEDKGNSVFSVADPTRHADSPWRRVEPLDEAEVLRLLWAYVRRGEETPALHVPLVNAVCYAIAGTLDPMSIETDNTTRRRPGRFAPEHFLAPRLTGLQAPVPQPLRDCLHQFLEEEDAWGRFNQSYRAVLHAADARSDQVGDAGWKTVLAELHRELGPASQGSANLQALCEKLSVLGDFGVRLREVFAPQVIEQRRLPWIPALIQNLVRLGRLAGSVLGERAPPPSFSPEPIHLVGDAHDAGQPPPGYIPDETLRRWIAAPPAAPGEIMQFAGSALERWFARGDELLSAWQRHDPDLKETLLAPEGKTSPFLTWLLRRCNDFRQAAWTEHVLRGDVWCMREDKGGGGLLPVVLAPAEQADRRLRRAAPLGPAEALALLRSYAAGGEEAAALHGPVVNALCQAIAGTMMAAPEDVPGPFAPECFLSPKVERSRQPQPESLTVCLKMLLVGEGRGRFNADFRHTLRTIAPERFDALHTAEVRHILTALTSQLMRRGNLDNLEDCCNKLEGLGQFAERLQLVFTEKMLKPAGPPGALLALQNLVRLGQFAANVLGDRSPPPSRLALAAPAPVAELVSQAPDTTPSADVSVPDETNRTLPEVVAATVAETVEALPSTAAAPPESPPPAPELSPPPPVLVPPALRDLRELVGQAAELRAACLQPWPEAAEALALLEEKAAGFQPAGSDDEVAAAVGDLLLDPLEQLDALLPALGPAGPLPSEHPVALVVPLQQLHDRIYDCMRRHGGYEYYAVSCGEPAGDHPLLDILGQVRHAGMRSFCVVRIVQPGYERCRDGRKELLRPPKVLVAQ